MRGQLPFSAPSAPPRETLSWKLPGTDEFTARGRCRSLDSLRSLGMTYTLRSLGMTYTLRSLGMTDSLRSLGTTVSA